MERVQRILNHSQYRQWLQAGEEREKNRVFCRHNLEHCLAVGRIAYILWLEQQGDPKAKPLFYGAALLHDIGKWQKVPEGQGNHGILSAKLAGPLLESCGFTPEEQAVMINAIERHSGRERWPELTAKKERTFAEVFYLADKLSRSCWACEAKEDCYWQRKNEELVY